MNSTDKEFQKWVLSQKPKTPREGEFREEHIYPKTGERHVLIFTCERDFNGKYICSVIGIEKKD